MKAALEKLIPEDVAKIRDAFQSLSSMGLKNYSFEIIAALDKQCDAVRELLKYCN